MAVYESGIRYDNDVYVMTHGEINLADNFAGIFVGAIVKEPNTGNEIKLQSNILTLADFAPVSAFIWEE